MSLVNAERNTSRIASVGMTRVIPSRLASMVAMVDLPTPVAPPSSTTSGSSRRLTICHLANESPYRVPTSSPNTSRASALSSSRVIDASSRTWRRASITSATWNARAGARPVAMIDDAIRPFE